MLDANGTRHHLLLGAHDWSTCTGAGFRVDPASQEVTLEPQPFKFPRGRGDRPPTLADRRGAAVDRFGNWYWIDPTGRSLLALSTGSGETSPFWRPGWRASCEQAESAGSFQQLPEDSPAPPAELRLAGLAVTEDHYLVAGLVEPRGLLVFDLQSGGPPRMLLWPEIAFAPFDMCARRGCGAWVLDRQNRGLWELDRHFRVVARGSAPEEGPRLGGFEPVEGSRAGEAPEGTRTRIDLDDAIELAGDPVSVEQALDGSVIVLDRSEDDPPSRLRRYAGGRQVKAEALLVDAGARLAVVAHDIAIVPDNGLGRLYAADREGNQAYAFSLELDDDQLRATLAREEYFPMRVFGGRALVGGAGGPHYDFVDRWVPLTRQRRPRFAPEATVTTRIFDGREPRCAWHRMAIDACIPPDAAVEVWSRVADEPRDLEAASWRREPHLHRRGDGAERPFSPPLPSERYGTWELLLQVARGRLLQLRVRMTGDGRSSPRLRALRVYYPRFSYLERYLPAVYREDGASASFLERFLANLEGLATGLEDRVAAAHGLLDPRTAPREELDWLASFFDVALDPAWNEERRRLFVRHAMDFFRWRGTIRGLELALRLALDAHVEESAFSARGTQRRRDPRVVERFRARRAPAVVAGDPTELGLPRPVSAAGRWTPADGPDELNRRWRAAAGEADLRARFPLRPPAAPRTATWRAFALDVLGFEPTAASDVEYWRSFLASRYRRIDALNDAWGLFGDARHDDFSSVEFPNELPEDGDALRDWHAFEAIAVPMRRAAHRFTVLLPVSTGADGGDEDVRAPEERRALARRVVDLQKPAHTTFDVKFYWAAFRLGEARLGEDTLIDRGSRSPRLLRPAVLGRAHAGESRLGGPPAPVLRARRTVGRDQVVL